MGGFGSGRSGGYGITESALTLDIAQCMRLRHFRPGAHIRGRIEWTMSHDGRDVASLGYEADMRDAGDAWVRLIYSTNQRGERAHLDYRVRLTPTLPHFGGVRWWFVCPLSGHRVRCLHSVGHCNRFAGRRFLHLGYKVQRESRSDQRLRAARVADAKLGGTGNLLDGPPEKPKWMRWRTYGRLVEERDRASLKSLMASLAVFDTQTARDLVGEAAKTDPDLVAGLRPR